MDKQIIEALKGEKVPAQSSAYRILKNPETPSFLVVRYQPIEGVMHEIFQDGEWKFDEGLLKGFYKYRTAFSIAEREAKRGGGYLYQEATNKDLKSIGYIIDVLSTTEKGIEEFSKRKAKILFERKSKPKKKKRKLKDRNYAYILGAPSSGSKGEGSLSMQTTNTTNKEVILTKEIMDDVLKNLRNITEKSLKFGKLPDLSPREFKKEVIGSFSNSMGYREETVCMKADCDHHSGKIKIYDNSLGCNIRFGESVSNCQYSTVKRVKIPVKFS